MADRLLSVDEAAAYLGRGRRFIYRLTHEKRIRYYKIGRFNAFDPTDLDAFKQAGRIEPEPRHRRWTRAV